MLLTNHCQSYIILEKCRHSPIHRVFGVWCPIFSARSGCYLTKHKILNTKHSRKKIAYLTYYEITKIIF